MVQYIGSMANLSTFEDYIFSRKVQKFKLLFPKWLSEATLLAICSFDGSGKQREALIDLRFIEHGVVGAS